MNPRVRKALGGISGILVTPFDAQDRLMPQKLKPIVDRAVRAGVHALVANGNTGEFYGLTTKEAETMVHAAAEHNAKRAVLIGGVGRSIHDAIALAKASRAVGAEALMVHQPPDPFVSPRGVVGYVQRIAEAGGGLPIMLYLRNDGIGLDAIDRKSTRLNSSHMSISYADFCLKNKKPALADWTVRKFATPPTELPTIAGSN